MFRAKLRTLVCKPPVNCSVTHKPLDNKNNGTCYDCYQFVIKRLIEIAETRINTGFFKQLDLFPLDGGGGFGAYVVDDAVYALDLVHYAHGHLVQHVVGYPRPVGGHEVARRHAAQGKRVIVGPAVSHDADGTHIGQHRKILAHRSLKLRLCDLVTENEVRLTQYREPLLGDLADDPYRKPRSGEGLAHDQILRQSQLTSERTNLVLEQQTQRLDYLTEIHAVGQSADVVMTLYDGGDVGAGLDDVGVYRTLNEIVNGADLPALVLEHTDKLLTDDLALRFGIGDALESAEEAILCVHTDEVYIAVLKRRLDLVALVFAHETVVHENAGELIADSLAQKRRCNGGVYAAGERKQHLAVADLAAYALDGGAHIIAHRPVALRSADAVQEIAQHL